MPALKLITAATVEPVTLSEMKAHLRVDEVFTDDDTYISGLISAARAHIEHTTGYLMGSQSWQMALDYFPMGNIGLFPYPYYNGLPLQAWQPFFTVPIYRLMDNPRQIKIPLGPLVSITSIAYIDANGVSATISASDYVVDNISLPGRICLKTGKDWPTPAAGLAVANGVLITFVAGYAPTTGGLSTAPADLKAAVKLLVAHWYENREDAQEADMKSMPFAVGALIGQYRMFQEAL